MGYKLAGCKVLAANEFVLSARETYRANFPTTHVFEEDVRQLTGAKILATIGMKEGELDILDGSPPCSPFSMAGRRQEGWDKVKNYSDGIHQRSDDLYYEYIRILREVKPKVFLTENVPALTKGAARGYFNDIFIKLRESGYRVKAAILNAKNFEVAQNRERLFIMGVRMDLNKEPVFPKPKPEVMTVGKAFEGLINQEWELKEAFDMPPSCKRWLQATPAGRSASDVHPNGSLFSLVRLKFTEPSPTITNIGTDSRNNRKRAAQCHPTETRYLTISELKRIGSFPDDFKLTGTFCQQWERIARAVPPNLMKNLALSIRQNILF